ncbi:MAG TPA: aminodeoxychorismate/anthranilate synthase component II [Williamwhitmania sp.]|jgi:anthranilate synthase component 2|nr:aminodeoxychorismate/anthranilate synthase component II [Williamwhitmania sp.]
MNVLVIDNYDSFTYNLVHMVEELTGNRAIVARNNEISVDEVGAFDKILLSPGPGLPGEAGNLKAIIKRYAPSKSIFGVCLGMQAIAEVFGGHLENLGHVVHGMSDEVRVESPEEKLFANMPDHFRAGRYHSWVVSKTNLPADLQITAVNPEGLVMALSHRNFDVKGVQFHPESILTQYGLSIMANWLGMDYKPVIELPSKSNSSFNISDITFGLTC